MSQLLQGCLPVSHKLQLRNCCATKYSWYSGTDLLDAKMLHNNVLYSQLQDVTILHNYYTNLNILQSRAAMIR